MAQRGRRRRWERYDEEAVWVEARRKPDSCGCRRSQPRAVRRKVVHDSSPRLLCDPSPEDLGARVGLWIW